MGILHPAWDDPAYEPDDETLRREAEARARDASDAALALDVMREIGGGVPPAQAEAEAEYAEAFRRRAEPVVADLRGATVAVVVARGSCPHCGASLAERPGVRVDGGEVDTSAPDGAKERT